LNVERLPLQVRSSAEASARIALDAERFAEHYQRGRQMSFDQRVQFGLAHGQRTEGGRRSDHEAANDNEIALAELIMVCRDDNNPPLRRGRIRHQRLGRRWSPGLATPRSPGDSQHSYDRTAVDESPTSMGASRVGWARLAAAAGLNDRELRMRCVRRKFARGEVIFHEGDPAAVMHLIDVGHVAIKLTTPMGEIGLIDIRQPGDTFGEQSLIDGIGVRTATTVAVGRVETLCLDHHNLSDLRDHHPDIDRFLLMLVSERLNATSQRLLEALYLPAETRVLRCVDRLRQMFAAGSESSIPLTQNDVAEMAGVTRSTANRVLRHAQETGLIRISRAHIDVCDVSGLRRKAGLRS
jgi:CRP/FNR family cyclic AMP-dependent transcriptional regulator